MRRHTPFRTPAIEGAKTAPLLRLSAMPALALLAGFVYQQLNRSGNQGQVKYGNPAQLPKTHGPMKSLAL